MPKGVPYIRLKDRETPVKLEAYNKKYGTSFILPTKQTISEMEINQRILGDVTDSELMREYLQTMNGF